MEKKRDMKSLSPVAAVDGENFKEGVMSDADEFDDGEAFAFDEDDAAVILEELAHNFGISVSGARTPSSRSSAAPTKTGLGRDSPRSQIRSCVSKALVEASLKAGRGSEGRHSPVRRLLSAKRNHIHSLSNDIFLLQKRIKELEERERVLIRITKRQEAALKRYQDADAQLPRLLEDHKIEVRTLRQKLSKAAEKAKSDSEKLKAVETRTRKLTEEVRRLKNQARKKDLPEKHVLHDQLTSTLEDLRRSEEQNKELNRRISILTKSFEQRLASENSKRRATDRKLESLTADHQRTVGKLTDREKQLATLQLYRSKSGGITSPSSRTSSTNTSATMDIPGAVSSSGNSCERKQSSKSAAHRLKPASSASTVARHARGKRTPSARVPMKAIMRSSCLLDSEELIIDLDAEAAGWTTDSGTGLKECPSFKLRRRRGSERLPPLGDAFQKKSSSASQSSSSLENNNNAMSSPDEDCVTSENQSSLSRDSCQTTSVALQEGDMEAGGSRKTTVVSSTWSDETHVEDFSLTRSNTPVTTLHRTSVVSSDEVVELLCDETEKRNGFDDEEGLEERDTTFQPRETELQREEEEEEEEEEEAFLEEERLLSFSLIENYPPKERRRLMSEEGGGSSAGGLQQGREASQGASKGDKNGGTSAGVISPDLVTRKSSSRRKNSEAEALPAAQGSSTSVTLRSAETGRPTNG